MSYCRFVVSDAYIYEDVYNGLTCCACSLMPADEITSGFLFYPDEEPLYINRNFVAGMDYDAMLAHVAEHRAKLDYIPYKVDERLKEEREMPNKSEKTYEDGILQGYEEAMLEVSWECGDCGNTYGVDVEDCPNRILDELYARKRMAEFQQTVKGSKDV